MQDNFLFDDKNFFDVEKSVLQFLEGASFFSYVVFIINFELVFKEAGCIKMTRKLFPLLDVKTSTSCRSLNKGFKKDGLPYPYISLLKKFIQVQHNVPFFCRFFLNTFYTVNNDKRGSTLTLHHNFLFKKFLINLFSFDFFRTTVLSKLYKVNQFVYSRISELRNGLLFRFRFHEVLLRSFFIASMLDERVNQQEPVFRFFQFLGDFNTLNDPLVLDLFFPRKVSESVFENKRFFIQFLSFFGFFFLNRLPKQFSNKFFIKLV